MLPKKIVAIFVLVMFVFIACAGGLVAPVGGELTDKDIALDKYHQALRLRNNTMDNLMANIVLFPVEEQKVWILRVDPIKQAVDTALAGWKTAIESESYVDMNANRAEFKRQKDKLIDLLVDLSQKLG